MITTTSLTHPVMIAKIRAALANEPDVKPTAKAPVEGKAL
ncbi:hypothetical protein vBPFY1MI_91 [Pseudomonas phage vB_PF_Y1-MI]|nr:hypothetical protein vBPFY1MI_91 [Pseudomonas phage vB_PF_Y1-MI]